jgi:excisionase family DNA binding protein
MEKMLSIPEAAEILGVSPRWVRRALTTKLIPYIKLGRLVRIETSEVKAYISAHRVDADVS